MHFIDTHTHLFAEEFDPDRVSAMKRAVSSGVNTFLLPNIDLSSIEALKLCAGSSEGHGLAMMGMHPCSVNENSINDLDSIYSELLSGYPYVGIGEIGLDLYWDKSAFDLQKAVFIKQCEWAVALNLAVSIHTRDAIAETIHCLKSMKKYPKGVFHCFTGSSDEAAEIIRMGFKLGIGGVITYKNSLLPEVLKSISPDHFVLETDSPYLSPVPYRGKRNESAYIPVIAEKLASVCGVSIETIAVTTTENARGVFGLQ